MQRAFKRVVFDVETIGCRWEDFSDEEREYLIEKAERDGGNAVTARSKLALSPLTGEIVLIGILNPDTGKGKVHVRWPPSHPLPRTVLPVPATLVTASFGDLNAAASTETTRCEVDVWPDEASLLRAFWDDVVRYDQVISFNGRAFDGMMTMLRSFHHGVEITRDLVPNRYHDSHLDLADRLTGYGAMRDRYTLDFWCRRNGIPSPKADGITGADVERLWRAGDLARLCRYNAAGDLVATSALFARYVTAYGVIHRIPAIGVSGRPADIGCAPAREML